MRFASKLSLLGLLTLLVSAVQTAQAVPVSFEFTASVSVINDNDPDDRVPDFTAGVTMGTIISGSFSYDTDTPLGQAITTGAEYFGTAAFPISMTINLPTTDITYLGDAGSPLDLLVRVLNDTRSGSDQFSLNDVEAEEEGPGLVDFMQMSFSGGTDIFADTSLPHSLDLGDFDDAFLVFGIVDRGPDRENLGSRAISANILTLTQVAQVPEPRTVLLIGLGLLALALVKLRRKP